MGATLFDFDTISDGKAKVIPRSLATAGLDELENVRRQWLIDAKGAEFHEDVDNLLLFWQLCNPIHVGVSKERIFVP